MNTTSTLRLSSRFALSKPLPEFAREYVGLFRVRYMVEKSGALALNSAGFGMVFAVEPAAYFSELDVNESTGYVLARCNYAESVEVLWHTLNLEIV